LKRILVSALSPLCTASCPTSQKSGDKVESCIRFVSASPRIVDSLGGIVSGIGRHPIPDFPYGHFRRAGSTLVKKHKRGVKKMHGGMRETRQRPRFLRQADEIFGNTQDFSQNLFFEIDLRKFSDRYINFRKKTFLFYWLFILPEPRDTRLQCSAYLSC
jgi:hypothetical protein